MKQETELSVWDRMLAVATLGLQRNTVENNTFMPDPSLNSMTSNSPATGFLRAAVANHLWFRAGKSAAQSKAEVIVSLPDDATLNLISESAAWRLGRMLSGDYAKLIPEWFGIAATSGKVLPLHWIPVILQHTSITILNQHAAVLGPCASALISLNEKWKTSMTSTQLSIDDWADGSIEQRSLMLSTMRRSDPTTALAWLALTWSSDPPEAREKFVAILRCGLSSQDESFLESALQDKRKSVRLEAAECLARLPTSQHADRNITRITPYINLTEPSKSLFSLNRRHKLEITLPTELSKEAQRDGIELKPPATQKIGEKTYWLVQMFSMVDPLHWQQKFNCEPVPFVQAVRACEFGDELFAALTEACVRHPRREWIVAVCNECIEHVQEPTVALGYLQSMIGAAPEESATLLEQLLPSVVTRDTEMALQLLDGVEFKWTARLTRNAMSALRAVMNNARQRYIYRTLLEKSALHCDVATAMQSLPELEKVAGIELAWKEALEHFTDIITFRDDMRRELQS